MVQEVIGKDMMWLIKVPRTYEGLLELLQSNKVSSFWKEELKTLRLMVDNKQAIYLETDLTYIITMILLNKTKPIY